MFDIFAHGGRLVVRKQPSSIELRNLRNNLFISNVQTECLSTKFQNYSNMLSRCERREGELICKEILDNLRGEISSNVFGEAKENTAL